MSIVNIHKLNEVYAEVDSDEFFVLKELVEYFTFKVPGAEFMPSFRNKFWDGKIRLLNPNNRKLYVSFHLLKNFVKEMIMNLIISIHQRKLKLAMKN